MMRIFLKYAYLCKKEYKMKVKLNLTIEGSLLAKVKRYAARRKTSISGLVEDYFRLVSRPSKRKTIIDLIDKLQAPQIDPKRDLKKAFHEDQAGKYGF